MNAAPLVSRNAAIRPASRTSNGAARIFPPAASTLRAVSSASAVAAYQFHTGGCPSPWTGPIAATESSPFRRIVYPPAPGSGTVYACQPNSPV